MVNFKIRLSKWFLPTADGHPYTGGFTISSPRGHQAYKVAQQPEDSKFAPGEFVLYALAGPDRVRKGLAFLRVCDGSILVHAWRSIFETPWLGHVNLVKACYEQRLGDDYEVKFHADCRRCSRALTTPESIDRGIGPVCAEKEALGC